MKKAYFLVFLSMCFWFVSSQYYYFDTWGSSYQQWCNETLSLRINTEWHIQWAKAGRFHLILDPQRLSYATSDVRNLLFEANTTTFQDWSSEASPSWKVGSSFSILQIDRKNNLTVYNWTNWIYWVISFIPRYSSSPYNAIFGMEYNWEIGTSNSTIETTLSSPFWIEIINPTKQYQFMTWSYAVLQQPCVADISNPSIAISYPNNWTTKQTNIWIAMNLADNAGSSSNVPYIWTGGVWTGNVWWIDPQYGIDISTLQITIAWNSQSRSFVWWTYATSNDKTWQFLDKNYVVSIPSFQLFDYGVEKPITMSVSIRDRLWHMSSTSLSFNQPQGPILITGTRFPVDNATFVAYDTPIRFGVEDDWAGVNSWSIVVTLSGVNWTQYWPYTFSGTQLLLSGLASTALQPNWIVEIPNHQAFPWSWTIRVSVIVRDMVGNLWTISDYNFVTRPSCSQLWCCADKYLSYKTTSFLITKSLITVQWWLNPIFSVGFDGTWYLNCGLSNQWVFIYKWSEVVSWSAQSLGFFDWSSLRIMGSNVKAVLSWSTLFLEKMFETGALSDKGGRGWWEFLERDHCPDWDNSDSYYDRTCEGGHEAADNCPVEDSPYTQELTDAFQFAYGLWITTMCPIENADMKWFVSRKHLAKMIVEYAVTIVGLYPDITKEWCDKYNDMEDQSSEMKFYSKIACQLGLMWLESDGIQPSISFNPNWFVTRAQFWTILSRLIFGETYNVPKSEGDEFYYIKHLQALKDNWIMRMIDNPSMTEVRWWVMLMLQRTYESWIIDQYRLLHNATNSIRVLYEF